MWLNCLKIQIAKQNGTPQGAITSCILFKTKLSWRDHINDIAEKFQHRLHILKYFAGSMGIYNINAEYYLQNVYNTINETHAGTLIVPLDQNIYNLECSRTKHLD